VLDVVFSYSSKVDAAGVGEQEVLAGMQVALMIEGVKVRGPQCGGGDAEALAALTVFVRQLQDAIGRAR
jgi:hypothetical protein